MSEAMAETRPTDSEIELEGKQWAQEWGVWGTKTATAWILGATWARGISAYNQPDGRLLEEKDKQIKTLLDQIKFLMDLK